MLALSSCTTIKNQEWCGDFGAGGADCFQTLRPETRTLNKKDWDQIRFGQVCTSASNYADIKAALEKLCSAGRCRFEKNLQGFEAVEKLGILSNEERQFYAFASKFIDNVERIDKKAKRLKLKR